MSDLDQLPEVVSSIFEPGSWVDGIDLHSMRLFEEHLEVRLNDLREDAEKAFIESEIEIFMQQRLIDQLMGTIRETWNLLSAERENPQSPPAGSGLDYLASRAAQTWSLYRQTRASGTTRTTLRQGKWSALYSDKTG